MALHGVVVHRADRAGPSLVAARWLARLGAQVTDTPDVAGAVDVVLASGPARPIGAPCAHLTGDPIGDVPGLPVGTLAYANGVALAGAAVLALLTRADVRADRRQVAVRVLLPLVLAAATGTEPNRPAPPRRVGDGYVQADLASDEDAETFERLLESLGPLAADPHAVADEAQIWRLPVCAYESRQPATALPSDIAGAPLAPANADGPAPLAGMVVCDLTAMWAGPMATALLVAAGAEVHKVEPAARVDGTRGTPLYGAVNESKRIHDLDATADRAELEALVRGSNLVIDSFSRRVMPNLDLAPARLSAWGVPSLSVPAFPVDHRWQLALGPGVHAASGLGDLGRGCVTTAVVAYPDPLAGLAAFATAAAMLRSGAPDHREVTLFGPAAELAATSPASRVVAERDPDLGRRFADDLDQPLFRS